MSSQPKWSLGSWAYEWNANGSLKSVKEPHGREYHFKYDAFGRRISKTYNGREFLYIWDKNVPLHEIQKEELCEDKVITWIFEGFTPTAKIVNGKAYSIISDHLGTPLQAIDTQGNKVWERELDIYGRVRKEFTSDDVKDRRCGFMPFLYQGQYYDKETELAYNRFRYYSPETGAYISQDPIRLNGNNPNLYAYVKDPNISIDIWGLDSTKLNAALGGVVGDGMAAHHLIPETVYNGHSAFFNAIGVERDDAKNGVLMPSTFNKAIELGDPTMIVHCGGHPNYIEEVREKVSKISDKYSAGDLTKDEAVREIRNLQTELRDNILKGNVKVKTTDCGGSRTLA